MAGYEERDEFHRDRDGKKPKLSARLKKIARNLPGQDITAPRLGARIRHIDGINVWFSDEEMESWF